MRIQIITIPKQSQTVNKIGTNKYQNGDSTLPNVSTSLKPIDREDSVLEAERGELTISPDLSTIHKILGKPHSQGGTPLNLPAGSFIYSKDKSLAFSKEDQKLFNFKLGGSIKKIDNTPAKVLERQVDIKHHNQMNAILEDDNIRDVVAKNTAKLMVQKNQEKFGQVAYLQEEKKNFKQGIPQFAENSQPIFSQHVKDGITTENQYMKTGGSFKPKYQLGTSCPTGQTWDGTKCVDNTTQQVITPFSPLMETYKGYYPNTILQSPEFTNSFTPNSINAPYIKGRPVGTQHLTPDDPNYYSIKDQKAIDYRNTFLGLMQIKYPDRFKGVGYQTTYNSLLDDAFNISPLKTGSSLQNNPISYDYSDETNKTIDDKFGKINASDRFFTGYLPKGKIGEIDIVEFSKLADTEQAKKAAELDLTPSEIYDFYYGQNNKLKTKIQTGVKIPGIISKTTDPVAVKEPTLLNPNTFNSSGVYTNQRVPFNTGQIVSLAGTALLNGMRKNFFPQRMENTFTPIELEKVNPNAALQENANAQLQGARIAATMGMNPSQSAGFIQKSITDGIVGGNTIRDKYDTQNVGIGNKQNEYNTTGFNTIRGANISNNNNYYNLVTTTLGRINEEKINGATDLLNKGLGYYGENLAMQHQLNAMQQYKMVNPDGTPILDAYGRQRYNTAYSVGKDGNYHFNNVSGWDNVNDKTNSSNIDNRITELNKQYTETTDRVEKTDIAKQITLLTIQQSKERKKKYGGYLQKLIID